MRKIITFLFIMTFTTIVINAQSIINGNFETWQATSIDDPTGSTTANIQVYQGIGVDAPLLVLKETDSHQGSFACKLKTEIILSDTIFGYCVFGSAGEDGPEGGFPYTQKPDSIVGWYKSDVNPADSALLLVVFSNGGILVSQNMFFLKGVHNTYTRFSFPLNLPLGFACDTVLLGFASSDPFTTGAPKPGSWIIVDDISFVGSGITQQVPNSNFEQWTNVSFDSPTDWFTVYNKSSVANISQTTDKYAGTYAAKMTTINLNQAGQDFVGSTLNGHYTNDGPIGGHPYVLQVDTLVGFYKYMPQGPDTAFVMIEFKKNGVHLDFVAQYLMPTNSYTSFSLPINLTIAPDTAIVYLSSSLNPRQSNVGSLLFVDEIQLKSQPLFTSIKEFNNVFLNMVYPNPAKDQLNVNYTLVSPETTSIVIFDLSGKQVSEVICNSNSGLNNQILNITHLSKGMYTLTIQTQTQHIRTTKFIVR